MRGAFQTLLRARDDTVNVLRTSIIGGIPTEHFSIKKLLGVIWIMEVFETTVAHGLKPFYRLNVLKLTQMLYVRPPCGRPLESDCSSSKQLEH